MLAMTSHADTLNGYVVSIADGDTLTILDSNRQQHKIRLMGIDAPEKAQAFGERSKQNLAALTFNKNVSVDWNKTDRYGRTVGKVMVNGVDANLEQIKAGMAWWYRDYAKEQSADERVRYEEAELMSKSRHVGIWGDINAMAPWDFRRSGARQLQVVESCHCSSGQLCTGPKGGQFCVTPSGSKSYK